MPSPKNGSAHPAWILLWRSSCSKYIFQTILPEVLILKDFETLTSVLNFSLIAGHRVSWKWPLSTCKELPSKVWKNKSRSKPLYSAHESTKYNLANALATSQYVDEICKNKIAFLLNTTNYNKEHDYSNPNSLLPSYLPSLPFPSLLILTLSFFLPSHICDSGWLADSLAVELWILIFKILHNSLKLQMCLIWLFLSLVSKKRETGLKIAFQ